MDEEQVVSPALPGTAISPAPVVRATRRAARRTTAADPPPGTSDDVE
ncbi:MULTISPECIES: hypothetical protein [unclassified Kitasatospora]